MRLAWILLAAALAAAAWNVVTTLRIYAYLGRMGQRPSFLLLRLHAPRYAGRYAAMTRARSGRAGPLFRHWVGSINAALVLAVVAMILLAS